MDPKLDVGHLGFVSAILETITVGSMHLADKSW
jgi:hypothetical protein